MEFAEAPTQSDIIDENAPDLERTNSDDHENVSASTTVEPITDRNGGENSDKDDEMSNPPKAPARVITVDTTDYSHQGPDENSTENATDPKKDPSTATLPKLLVPSLRGKMTFVGGTVVCTGLWAMSDKAHSEPDQTSNFEFKLVKADDPTLNSFPINGTYQGWFQLKLPPPLKVSNKIEDKEIHIAFTAEEGTCRYIIKGKGVNKFGSFNLTGTLDEEGNIQLYREYYNLTPSVATASKRRGSFGGDTPTVKRVKVGNSNKQNIASTSTDGTDMVSPRESAGRVRKQSSIMKDYENRSLVKAQSKATTVTSAGDDSAAHHAPVPPQHAPVHVERASIDRSHRIKTEMKKSLELLKTFERHPHGAWFIEPVDYIRLNIPDYPKVVKQPMDFSTIRSNIETGSVDSMETFAEAVRLVFRNAIAFNQLEENVVRIAAIELSKKFEEKYRVLNSQFGNAEEATLPTGVRGKQAGKQAQRDGKDTPKSGVAVAKGNTKGKEAFGRGRHSTGSSQQMAPPVGAGPRYAPATAAAGSGAYLPSGMDGNSSLLMELQRQMQSMQEEISQLRTAVRENEVMRRLNDSKEAAHNPLTFDEKKTLIEQIHKLPSNKMQQILEIIQSSHSVNQKGEEEIEVPLDELDTYTLRKLQKFVEENAERKKRGPPLGSTRASSSSSAAQDREPGQKRQYNKTGQYSKHNTSPRKGVQNPLPPNMMQQSALALQQPDSFEGGGMEGEAAPIDDNEDLLFEADSFEQHEEQEVVTSAAEGEGSFEQGDTADGVDAFGGYSGYVGSD